MRDERCRNKAESLHGVKAEDRSDSDDRAADRLHRHARPAGRASQEIDAAEREDDLAEDAQRDIDHDGGSRCCDVHAANRDDTGSDNLAADGGGGHKVLHRFANPAGSRKA